MQVDVVVVEIGVDAEGIELPGFRRHPVGLLVVAPVAQIADARRGEEIGSVRRLLEVRTGPADRALAGGVFDRLDRGADVLPLLLFRHADMDHAPARETVRDELGIALLALLDQERVMIGYGLVEREGGLDAVFVEHGENAKDPDPVAVFVVAVAADVGKVRLVAAPQALGAAQRAHRQRRAGRHLPVPMFEVDDDGEGDAGVLRPPENGARNDRGPGIKVVVHAVGSICRHRATPPAFVLNCRSRTMTCRKAAARSQDGPRSREDAAQASRGRCSLPFLRAVSRSPGAFRRCRRRVPTRGRPGTMSLRRSFGRRIGPTAAGRPTTDRTSSPMRGGRSR